MSPEQIIEQWVAVARAAADTDDLQIGENISTHPAIKIAFDGYGEDDDGMEDLDRECYSVYIHRDATTPGFVFPEHERTAWAIVQRPADEVCHTVWFNAAEGYFDGPSLADSCAASQLNFGKLVKTIVELHDV
jgi:hypothetical protein